jgi:hypothetical protein
MVTFVTPTLVLDCTDLYLSLLHADCSGRKAGGLRLECSASSVEAYFNFYVLRPTPPIIVFTPYMNRLEFCIPLHTQCDSEHGDFDWKLFNRISAKRSQPTL